MAKWNSMKIAFFSLTCFKSVSQEHHFPPGGNKMRGIIKV